MKISREFHFDAAIGNGKDLHGHTYTLGVTLEGEVKENGMVLDFVKLKKIIKARVLDRLDHQNLSDVIDNPTAENLAEWISRELKKELPVSSIKLWVGEGKWVEV